MERQLEVEVANRHGRYKKYNCPVRFAVTHGTSIQAPTLASAILRFPALRGGGGWGGRGDDFELKPTIGCKTHDTLQNFGIFLMNVALQLKKIAKFPPAPQSMLITRSGTMVTSCLVNIVQGGGGGCFT